MAKRYYWLKLKEDFFQSKRIKKLRRIAGGDTYVIIYLKMQLMAMQNEGYIRFSGLEKTLAEELALDLDEDEDNVAVTLQYLISTGLIETSNDIDFYLPYAVENVGSETAVAQRVRDFRARQALQCNNSVTDLKQNCNVEKEIDKDIDIDIDIEQEERKKDRKKDSLSFVRSTIADPIGHGLVVLSEAQLDDLRSRLSEEELNHYCRVVAECEAVGRHFSKTHYRAILDMAREDRGLTDETI